MQVVSYSEVCVEVIVHGLLGGYVSRLLLACTYHLLNCNKSGGSSKGCSWECELLRFAQYIQYDVVITEVYMLLYLLKVHSQYVYRCVHFCQRQLLEM